MTSDSDLWDGSDPPGEIELQMVDTLSRVETIMANVQRLMTKHGVDPTSYLLGAADAAPSHPPQRGDRCSRSHEEHAELADRERLRGRLAALTDELKGSRAGQAALEEKVHRLRAELQVHEGCAALLEEKERVIADLHTQVEALQRVALEGQTKAAQRLELLQRDRDEARREVAAAAERAESDRRAWEAERTALCEQIAALQGENWQQRIEALTAQLEGHGRALDDSHAETIHAQHQLSTTQLELEETERKLRALEETHQQTLARYCEEMATRKRLFNQLQDLRGSIRVLCRVRPLLPACDPPEAAFNPTFDPRSEGAIRLTEAKQGPERAYVKEHRFEFDRVFAAASTQEEVFAEVHPLVTSVMDGYNVCIFAYGQTGSGKTYTMEGVKLDGGLYRRTLDALFAIQGARQDAWQYSMRVSVVEVYNDNAYDLLAADPRATALEVRQTPQRHVMLNCQAVDVQRPEDALRALERGQRNRSVGQTDLNLHSSRSHCLLTVHVEGVSEVAGERLTGKLHLIDLAGSEKSSKTIVNGGHQAETAHINKSLSALGDVIRALAHKDKHVPYRNSALTFILSDSLGGDSKVLLIANINPSTNNVPESLSTLNFAAGARKVELGRAKKNVQRL